LPWRITGKIIELDGGAERPVFPDISPDLSSRSPCDHFGVVVDPEIGADD
jgi:hypothetical protein